MWDMLFNGMQLGWKYVIAEVGLMILTVRHAKMVDDSSGSSNQNYYIFMPGDGY
jgi:hypothetical protein